MRIEALRNMMRLEALKAVGNFQTLKKGTISSYDPNNYSAKVLLQPENKETGWLPIASDWVGNGWGMFCPPSIGDMVDVHFDEGDRQSGYVSKRFFNDEDRPLAVESGEFWLVHKSGSLLKFKNSGDVELLTNRDLLATVGRNLTANVTGNVSADVTGNVQVNNANSITLGNLSATIYKLVNDTFMALFNSHTHTKGVGVSTQPPDQTMDTTHLTNILKGN